MEAFRRYLTDRLGQYVLLDRNGPHECQGWVLNVGSNYLTLYCIDGTRLHLPLHHIRSVTPLPHPAQDQAPPTAPVEEWPETYGELLARHLGQEVQLNHAGPDVIVGKLLECTDDYLLLETEPESLACLPCFHLRSLCLYTAWDLGSEGSGLSFAHTPEP